MKKAVSFSIILFMVCGLLLPIAGFASLIDDLRDEIDKKAQEIK